MLLLKKYRAYLQIDIHAGTVAYSDQLIAEMEKEKENHILICEIQNCI